MLVDLATTRAWYETLQQVLASSMVGITPEYWFLVDNM